jgi:tRNA threonylcarbamoyladenosine biosynthesis protein TsaE
VTLALHPPILETRSFVWPDEAACAASAQRLARVPALADAFITLNGPLGAGKTTFVRHLLRALGVGGRVKSPTFAVLESYQAQGLEVSHFDFYRFDEDRGAAEFDDAGFREVFSAPGLKLAEWPQRAGSALPRPDLGVELKLIDSDQRAVQLTAFTPRGRELAAALTPPSRELAAALPG